LKSFIFSKFLLSITTGRAFKARLRSISGPFFAELPAKTNFYNKSSTILTSLLGVDLDRITNS
jgi:hypothetical protein